jgi:uncharacterized protein (TIGR03084 family)
MGGKAADQDGPDALSALTSQHRELSSILDALREDDWQRETRCPGWSVADVVLHLVQTDEMAVASLEDRVAGFLAERVGGDGAPTAATVDDGAALMVERERGLSSRDLLARWSEGGGRLREMLASADTHKRVTWVAGELSVRTLTTTRLAEAWIHSGDVAEAVGAKTRPDERLRHIARLAWRTLPYAFAREGRELHGPVEFDLIGPEGDRWSFVPDTEPVTVVRGDGVELCMVAARRLDPEATSLEAVGPDAAAVLAVVRTYA